MALTPSTESMKLSSVCPSDEISGLTKVDSKDKGSRSSDVAPKSPLITHVDETELTSALVALRSNQSKEKSIKILSIDDKTSSSSKSCVEESPSEKSAGVTIATRDAAEYVEKDIELRAESLHLPPRGLLEVAISLDTTRSLGGILNEIREKIQDFLQRLQANIPGIRISIIAHGDYFNEGCTYVIKWIDFGASLPEICEFVKNVERTDGGDQPECCELVMLRAREALSWTPGSQHILIMTYDNIPHEPGYTYEGKTYNIDWRVESAGLRDMSVKIYAVMVRSNLGTPIQNFGNEITRITGGINLSLNNFSNMFDMLMMICYMEGNPDMLPREKVPDAFMTKGPMRALTWSRWKLAIQPTLIGKHMKTKLEESRIFWGYIPKVTSFETTNSALYEFAVQCLRSRKKHVLYFRMSKCGFIRKRALSSYLLRHKTVCAERS